VSVGCGPGVWFERAECEMSGPGRDGSSVSLDNYEV
jgi:hypothetical protein